VEREVLALFDALPVLDGHTQGLSSIGLGEASRTPKLADAPGNVAYELVGTLTTHARSVTLLALALKPSYMMVTARRQSIRREAHNDKVAGEREQSAAFARDVPATLIAEVSRCAARVGNLGAVLENIGGGAVEATCDIGRRFQSQDLERRAHRVRGVVMHGLSVLCELQCEAGRLHALAALQALMDEQSVDD
jgi:hypothetical protein